VFGSPIAQSPIPGARPKWRLRGVDLVKFNAADKMIEFEVMIRPIKALYTPAGEIGNRIGRNSPG